MSNGSESRERGRARIALRIAPTPLDRLLPAADIARDLKSIATRSIRYVNEIYAPNIKEPYSITNRRLELVEQVRAYQVRRGIRRAA